MASYILKIETNGFSDFEDFSILEICITDLFGRILYARSYYAKQTDQARQYNRFSQEELDCWKASKIIKEFMCERALQNIFDNNAFIVKSKEFYEKYFEVLGLETPELIDLQELILAKTGRRHKIVTDLIVPDTAYNDCLCMIEVINKYDLLDLDSAEEIISLDF